MLEQEKVDLVEESLRIKIRELDDEKRKLFFLKVKKKIKDPDTYAVLNWFFLAGLHHFYLGKILRGTVNLIVFLIGILFFFIGQIELGIFLICFILIVELWALFRSQIIIQDWNNKVYEETLSEVLKESSYKA